MTDDRFVDPARTACLCNQGLPGWIAAVVVDPDGAEGLWLLDLNDVTDTGGAS